MNIKVKRIYEKESNSDGYRILVDRIWPRGVKNSEVKIDLWMKEIAPSNELRKWFAHDIRRWISFKAKYSRELRGKMELLHQIKKLQKQKGIVTLLYSAKDEEHNNAVALKCFFSSDK
ncbi:MAG: DUF488 family protein [bacterium]|jgi:uncharacterized protein YeaO (DUF488 family)|nr:DUF488 family protein [bacterium]